MIVHPKWPGPLARTRIMIAGPEALISCQSNTFHSPLGDLPCFLAPLPFSIRSDPLTWVAGMAAYEQSGPSHPLTTPAISMPCTYASANLFLSNWSNLSPMIVS